MRAVSALSDAETIRSMALACVEAGAPDEAEELLLRALELDRGNLLCLRDLAVLQGASGRWEAASETLRLAQAAAPDDAATLSDLGRALTEAGEAASAVEILAQARSRDPGDPRIVYRQACAQLALGETAGALERIEECLAADPAYAPALRRAGELYRALGHPHIALERYECLARLRPDDPETQALLAAARWYAGDIEASAVALGEIVNREAAPSFTYSAYIATLLHREGETGASLRSAAEDWARRYAPAAPPAPIATSFDPDRRIRVAYVTHEFGAGPAHFFLLPLVRDRDHENFEVFAYHLRETVDAEAALVRGLADGWRQLTPDHVAGAAAEDGIDILVDTAGHYGPGLPAFLARIAPLQMTFPSYPGTTGAPEIDHILTDRWVCPPGEESQYSERPIFLDSGYLPYAAPDAPPPAELPAFANGHLTFGLFQRPPKMNARVWDAVASILRAVPESRLLIHYGLAELDDPGSPVHARFARELDSRGVEPARARTRGPAAHLEHLAILAQCDIALDTFPYNGQTTTCECLWMGVPVVTLAGGPHVARVGLQILGRVGLDRLVADSPESYVEKAVGLGAGLDDLAVLRSELRERMQRSPLLDGSVVRAIEHAYRKAWRQRCKQQNNW
ncbi:MAG: tetratricopeptide repeat protein [Bryobacteraceae bacterium]